MGDTIEIILEYLRRYHFTKAESALKAELDARQEVDGPLPSCDDVLDWDLELRLRSLQGAGHSVEAEQTSIPSSERNACQNVSSQEEESRRSPPETSRSPPEKHLYVEYESSNLDYQEPGCISGQEFMFDNPRTSPEPEVLFSSRGSHRLSETCEQNSIFQPGSREELESDNVPATTLGMGCTDSLQQGEGSQPGRLISVGSLEDLQLEGQTRPTGIEPAEQALTWAKSRMQEERYAANVAAYDAFTGWHVTGPRNDSQQDIFSGQLRLNENELPQRHWDMTGERLGSQHGTTPYKIDEAESLKDSVQLQCTTVQDKADAPAREGHAEKVGVCLQDSLEKATTKLGERGDGGSQAVVGDEALVKNGFVANFTAKRGERGDGSSQAVAGDESLVKNGFVANFTHEGTFKDAPLKTPLPFALLKPSLFDERQRSVKDITTGLELAQEEGRITQETEAVLQDNAKASPEVIEGEMHSGWMENRELKSSNGMYEPEELPRLPPVRLRSMDKNIENSKDGSAAENSTRSFESTAFRSIGSTPEGTFGMGAFLDVPLGQEVLSSGLKRPMTRPSVSQGIVEDTSERLSGFATAGDGQSESARDYPDEYWDSDTYEDDDDPGYHRQPIEDEVWFLAHEIDYPSDDERAKNRVENSHNAYKQFGKFDEDDRSLVEEESYFSGEEYYRSQAAKEELYRSQPTELRDQVDRAQLTYNSLHSRGHDSNPTHLRSNDGDDYNGQLLDAEELNMMRSEPVWKGFIGQSNELEGQGQDKILCDGDRSEEARAYGVDDDRQGSVRSGGVGVSSDAADIGSEVRDSLLGGSSEGDLESFRDQELVAYGSAHGRSGSEERFGENEGRHVEVKSAPVRHLDEEEEEEERDEILRYYNEAWGHKQRTVERQASDMDVTEREVLKNKMAESKHRIDSSNKEEQDNGVFGFGGFSFPSPSSAGDLAASRADSGKSLWSTRDSTAQGEETDEYGSGMIGPDDTLAAWKRKSNESSPIICPSDENLPLVIMSHGSTVSAHSTDEYVSMEAREDGIEGHDAVHIQEGGQVMEADDEDADAAQEEIRRLSVEEDQYEIFDLRIVHRRNRTGFEEDKDFPVVINSVIAGRYHVTEYLGSAAFSKAIQAHDLHTGIDVCMKIIKNNKDFFDQSLDEIKLLKFINKHDPADKYHILRLYDYFYHREHLFIVCELLRANLYEFHKFNRESGGEVYFTMPRLQSITRQCLEALEFLHGLGLIHCDLKPENILVKSYSRCEIKVIDLGSSCFQTDHLCSYVQSRSYRAPEVILGLPYDQKIDIWSLGCILAELCSGNVLFQNDSLATLLARVVGILGPIDPKMLAKGRDTHKYFTKNHMLYERNQENDQLEYLLPKKTTLSHRLAMGDQGFVEFVGYLLQINPAKRPSAAEALKHPWLLYPYEPISS